GDLPEKLVATGASGSPIRKSESQQIGAPSRRQAPVMFFKDAGFNQCLAQAMHSLLWPAELPRQLGWRQRFQAVRDSLQYVKRPQVWWNVVSRFRHATPLAAHLRLLC
ncbi:MAG: hypothetical protein VYB04_03085, partial [Pseudomonadota bacterium]|nr:hypothetical protein [Pseudomonadota bacterium]